MNGEKEYIVTLYRVVKDQYLVKANTKENAKKKAFSGKVEEHLGQDNLEFQKSKTEVKLVLK
jgi:hypothetical protein